MTKRQLEQRAIGRAQAPKLGVQRGAIDHHGDATVSALRQQATVAGQLPTTTPVAHLVRRAMMSLSMNTAES